MSTVSLPAWPSMVMVLRRRLVAEKSPMARNVSPAPAPPAAPVGSTPLMRISSMSRSSAMIEVKFVPFRVMMI
jgi:hypothetical protein